MTDFLAFSDWKCFLRPCIESEGKGGEEDVNNRVVSSDISPGTHFPNPAEGVLLNVGKESRFFASIFLLLGFERSGPAKGIDESPEVELI